MIKSRLFIVNCFVALPLLISATELSAFSQTAARDVLERFCELDAQGKQLTSEGWHEIAVLFVTPGAPRQDKIIVVRDFVVSHPVLEKDRAEFYVEYIQLGQIDPPRARFSRLPPVKVRAGFDLVLKTKRSEVGPSGTVTQAEGPTEWRITGSVPEPHLTVEAAIRYVTEVRAKARDAAIRKNAEKMITDLKRLR